MSRLIVVSNRVPAPRRAPQGGLAVALHAALAERGGIWMGWSGQSSGDEVPGPLSLRREGSITYALSALSERDLAEYYNGLANSVLWPLCHYRTDLTDYSRRDAAGYRRVNCFFAERLAPLVQPDDILWVHDYHLIPLAQELRRLGIRNRIGFFMHIPWPGPDVFITLPCADDLLKAMTHYDLIGFQTELDAGNFSRCLRRRRVAVPIEGAFGLHSSAGGPFTVGHHPISVDTGTLQRNASAAVRSSSMRKVQASLEGRQMIIGVDRLDYTKGLPQRILAFGRFLDTTPEWSGKATYLQITPRTREGVAEYDSLRQEVASLAGQINGAHGHLDWTPVRYVNRAFSQIVLAGLYRMANVGLVTPMRDGMNLVAKEYVAAQDAEDPGVLILSQFAGAAAELADGALLVNPYDDQATSRAIARAVVMSLEERKARHAAMISVLTEHDVFAWCARYIETLERGLEGTGAAENLTQTLGAQDLQSPFGTL